MYECFISKQWKTLHTYLKTGKFEVGCSLAKIKTQFALFLLVLLHSQRQKGSWYLYGHIMFHLFYFLILEIYPSMICFEYLNFSLILDTIIYKYVYTFVFLSILHSVCMLLTSMFLKLTFCYWIMSFCALT